MLNQHKQGFYEKRVDIQGFSFFPKVDKSKAKAKGKRKMEKEKPPRRMGRGGVLYVAVCVGVVVLWKGGKFDVFFALGKKVYICGSKKKGSVLEVRYP